MLYLPHANPTNNPATQMSLIRPTSISKCLASPAQTPAIHPSLDRTQVFLIMDKFLEGTA